MKFRTEVNFQNSNAKIEITDQIFSIGSCFATEMSSIFAKAQLQVYDNPFGTIYNPYSINYAIQRMHNAHFYQQEDLIIFDDQYISLDHHSSFNSNFAHKTLEKINHCIEDANQFLQKTNWVIITYGSSFIYQFLPKGKLAANCHKIPQKYFEKRLLSWEEIYTSITETVLNLNDICPENLQILFTVSPVRHTKDGMVENQHSKAKLISGIHEVIQNFDNCHYLPIYEILMDDLRDYRFYKEDLIHPNNQAIQYIFEKFANAYFSQETKEFVTENLKIHQALAHRSSNDKGSKHQLFLEKLQERIAQQQKKVKHKIFDF